MQCAYPLVLDVSRRLVVIVGGGRVAARKVAGLLAAGAGGIRCISPAFAADFPQAKAVEWVVSEYRSSCLEGASLVFAATDDAQVNSRVVEDAHRMGLLVNRADSDEQQPGDFASPAVLREGELLITVSAGGSPALAAVVRDALRKSLDLRWVKMSQAMQELRPRITGRADLPIEERRSALRDLASEEAMQILHDRGIDALWTWLGQKNRALAR